MLLLLLIAGALAGSRASTDQEHEFNDKFLDTLIKTKDSRTFLNDLIYKIQMLLNDTDEQHPTVSSVLPKGNAPRRRIQVLSSPPLPIRHAGGGNSTKAVTSLVLLANGSLEVVQQGNVTSTTNVTSATNITSATNLSNVPSGPGVEHQLLVFNQTGIITNDTVVDVSAEREMKKLVNQEASQRVATLGVIICLTFVGTATCIVVMALYSSKFSGIVLLSNGRWWCPMVTRGNGVERQLLV